MPFKSLKESLKLNEGFRPTVYKDHLGYDTIGYGFAIKDLVLDEDIAGLILERDIFRRYMQLNSNFDWFSSQPDNVRDVCVEMVYQLGFSGFCKFKKTIQYLIEGDYGGASMEMLNSKWALQTPARAKKLSQSIKNGA